MPRRKILLMLAILAFIVLLFLALKPWSDSPDATKRDGAPSPVVAPPSAAMKVAQDRIPDESAKLARLRRKSPSTGAIGADATLEKARRLEAARDLLNAAEPKVRLEALRVLWQEGSMADHLAMKAVVNDSDQAVGDTALRFLCEVRHPQAEAALAGVLRDASLPSARRIMALQALKRYRTQVSIGALLAVQTDENRALAMLAGEALAPLLGSAPPVATMGEDARRSSWWEANRSRFPERLSGE